MEFFTYKHIVDHSYIRTSAYAEQNNASKKTRIPDSKSRTLEEFVSLLLERHADLMQMRQKDYYAWEATETEALSKLSKTEREELAPARGTLHRVPYERFARRVELYRQYNTEEVTIGNRTGTKLTHTCSKEKSTIVWDGKRCDCEHRIAFYDQCQHEAGKRVSRGLPAFDIALFSQRSIFHPTLPKEPATTQDLGATVQYITTKDGVFASSAKIVKSDFSIDNPDSSNDNTFCTDVVRSNDVSSNVLSIAASPPKGQYFSSHRLKKVSINSNVKYASLKDTCAELGQMAASMDNSVQHLVRKHVNDFIDLLKSGNFGDPSYEETTVGPLAERLNFLSDERTKSHHSGMLKLKSVVPRQGKPRAHRLGSDRSQSGKRSTTCGFCRRTDAHPRNATHCPEKAKFGICYSRASKETDIENLVENMLKGTTIYPDVTNWSVAQGKQWFQKVPNPSKRIQIKGYAKGTDDMWYLLCTCITNEGKQLSRKEGSVSTSYTDVLIREKAVLAAITKCDYVFFSPAVQEKCEVVCTNASKVAKTMIGDVKQQSKTDEYDI